jgi:protein-tyrosine kinase
VGILDQALRGIRKSQPSGAQDVRADISRAIGGIVDSSAARTAGQSPTTNVSEMPSPKTIHVDRDALRRSGLLPPESQGHELGTQYRVIKRTLLANAFGAQSAGAASPRLIMVSSALPGDGKTFNCINVALSLALERDCSVVLIDCDAIKPEVSRRFGMRDEPGLLDLLEDPTRSIESLICPTDVPRLSMLPAGKQRENSAELIASGRLREICSTMIERLPRRIVLFDTPPILLTSEARALASVAGQIVLVVKAGFTPQQAVRDAIEALGADKPISLLLNQVSHSGGIGYYYGQYYGDTYRPVAGTETELP